MMSEPTPIDPDEKVIWSGTPDPASYAMRKGGLPFLFGIVYFGAALYWYIAFSARSRVPNQLDLSLLLFGIAFAALGAGLVLLPVWHYLRARRTIYTLTN